MFSAVLVFPLRLRCPKLCPSCFCCLRNLRSRSRRHHPLLPANRFTAAQSSFSDSERRSNSIGLFRIHFLNSLGCGGQHFRKKGIEIREIPLCVNQRINEALEFVRLNVHSI